MTGPLLSEFEKAHLMTGLPHIDPTEPDTRGADNDAKRALFLETKDLLDEKGVFMLAIRSLRIRWFQDLMDTTERSVKDDLTARLKALSALPVELSRFISDHKMALDKQRKHG